MFSHIFVGADDVARFEEVLRCLVLGAIGVPEGKFDPKGRVFYRTPTGTFGITEPIDGKAATHANGGTIGFTCDSIEKVKAFHDAGVATGGKSIEDAPGWREGGGVRLIWPICAIHTATRSAPCTAADARIRGGDAQDDRGASFAVSVA